APTPQDIWRNYPDIFRAEVRNNLAKLKPATVRLNCVLDIDYGTVRNCDPIGKPSPKFLVSAQRAAGLYVFDTTAMADGEPGCRQLRLTIHFTVFDKPPPFPLAPDCCGQGSVVTSPQWIAKPSIDDIRAALPPLARARGIGGLVRMTCKITVDAHLRECRPEWSQVVGYALPVAALKLAPLFQLIPFTPAGEPVGEGIVTVPITFPAANPPTSPP
ncbi:MAG TPA: hypothetical protein VFN88_05385, partial [Caulobacteraceae bacterium]|nr:hypothetical protein [Caulobacteraceae bacterium]